MATYRDLITTYNPVGYWQFEEAAGTTVADAIGTQSGVYQQGVALGSAGAIAGTSTSAARFDGSNDYIEIAHNDAFLLGNGSLQFWFNPDRVSGLQGLFSKDSNGYDTGGHFGVYLDNGRLRVRSQSTSATREIYSAPVVTAGTWHQVVVTWGSGGLQTYLNGVLVASDNNWKTSLLGNREPIVLGTNQWRSGDLVADTLSDFYSGSLDEVALFGQALSATEVAALYTAGTTPAAEPPTEEPPTEEPPAEEPPPPNTAPIAGDDSLSTDADTPVTFSAASLLSNDSDADNDPLSITAMGQPANGTLTQANGTYTYTPNPGFAGTDSVSYTISDGRGGSDQGSISITVLAPPPPVSSDQPSIQVTPQTGLSTGENGTTAQFQVVLTAQPTANVTIPIRSSNAGEGIILSVNGQSGFSDLLKSYAPKAYWRLSETSGTQAADTSGTQNGVYKQGVTLGAAGVLAGDTNSSARFDGVNDYVEIAHSSEFLLASGALQLWFKADKVSGVQALFSKDSNGYDTGGHMGVFIDNGRLRVRSQTTSSNQEFYSSALITTGTWHQVVVNWGANGLSAYLDGSVVISVPTWKNGLLGNQQPITLGANQWRSSDLVADNLETFFQGQMDEVALFAQPLSSTAIQSLYAAAQTQPSTTTITFTPNNWDTPQTVTVQGVNDPVVDSQQPYSIILDPATSSDSRYNGLNAPDVVLTNQDNDVAGFSLSKQTITVSESGTTDTFTVVLSAKPLSQVTFNLTSSDLGEASVSTNSLIFTPDNWNVPQTVTVAGVNDTQIDGAQASTLTLSVNAATSDSAFRSLPSQTIAVTTLDNDTANPASLDYSSESKAVLVRLDQGSVSRLNYGAMFNLMPVGDSITEGYDASYLSGNASYRANHEGYRLDLWQALNNAYLPADFVGSLSHGPSSLGDKNHEGHSGKTILWMQERINGFIDGAKPDVMLLMIGTNDGSRTGRQIASYLSGLLDTILADTDFTGHVLVGTVAPVHPGGSWTSRTSNLANYNSRMANVVASKNSSRLKFVEVGSLLDPVADMADPSVDNGLHPNQQGYAKMAQAWFDALTDVVVADTASFSNRDHVTGSNFDDVLVGNEAANTLTGGLGADVLTGQGGPDAFVFQTASEGMDIITDLAGNDVIQVVAAGFGGSLQAGFNLSQSGAGATFVSGSNPTPSTSQTTFLYNTSSGILSYDIDGQGGQAAIDLVRLNGAPGLSASQIQLV